MPQQQGPIRVGIIGTGIFAYRHMRAYRHLGADKFVIVACSNRSREKAEKFAQEAGIPEQAIFTDPNDLIALPNVDLVDVILPIQFNRAILEACVAAGKNALFEKPIAADLNDARAIVKLGQSSPTVVALAENWAYHPKVQAVAEFVRGGGIGKIINFTYDSARPFNPDSPYLSTTWRQNPQHPGGYLSDGCVHDMGHLVPILGRFESVSAMASSNYKEHYVKEETLATTIRLCSAGVKRMLLEIHGSNGTLRLINDTDIELLDDQGLPLDVSQFERPDALSDVEGELSNLYNVIVKGDKLGISLDEGFHHLAFIVSALESAESGRQIKIASV
ncbi:NAD(P)-binding protein [Hesseltinella vesiculosa]|uniref:NAD(P)-binding protein n=1 Tax=Hesseltinella vesiculosa TaxID=101127 RepID=A0A1X2GE10_9FUNG|nr:NAD(P)-binding protein [Hesseltinella vesiculosa]